MAAEQGITEALRNNIYEDARGHIIRVLASYAKDGLDITPESAKTLAESAVGYAIQAAHLLLTGQEKPEPRELTGNDFVCPHCRHDYRDGYRAIWSVEFRNDATPIFGESPDYEQGEAIDDSDSETLEYQCVCGETIDGSVGSALESGDFPLDGWDA